MGIDGTWPQSCKYSKKDLFQIFSNEKIEDKEEVIKSCCLIFGKKWFDKKKNLPYISRELKFPLLSSSHPLESKACIAKICYKISNVVNTHNSSKSNIEYYIYKSIENYLLREYMDEMGISYQYHYACPLCLSKGHKVKLEKYDLYKCPRCSDLKMTINDVLCDEIIEDCLMCHNCKISVPKNLIKNDLTCPFCDCKLSNEDQTTLPKKPFLEYLNFSLNPTEINDVKEMVDFNTIINDYIDSKIKKFNKNNVKRSLWTVFKSVPVEDIFSIKYIEVVKKWVKYQYETYNTVPDSVNVVDVISKNDVLLFKKEKYFTTNKNKSSALFKQFTREREELKSFCLNYIRGEV